ncbi:MAG TPA: type IV toxin-antitoxin system AbiEi family antitoxin domain-containing protein [Streptosporangiaceae bacterium]
MLQQQCGVVTRAQALSSGMTPKQVEARLRSGRWQRLHPGVYATFTGNPRRSAFLWAALLRAGNEAVLSHYTAAELHGLAATPATTIHVTVPSGQLVSPICGVALHYSSRLGQARHPARTPPQTRIEETVLDLAAGAASLDEALGWIFRACGSRKTTAARLAATLGSRGRVRWRTELSAALGLGADGVHSLLEFRYVSRVERPHGLPAGTRQYQVTRDGQHQYQDVTYQAFGVVVELDGRVAHPEELRWRDIRRDNASAVDGQQTLRYGWADVTERPCEVADEVGALLFGRGWNGRLRGAAGPASSPPGQPAEPDPPKDLVPTRATGVPGLTRPPGPAVLLPDPGWPARPALARTGRAGPVRLGLACRLTRTGPLRPDPFRPLRPDPFRPPRPPSPATVA